MDSFQETLIRRFRIVYAVRCAAAAPNKWLIYAWANNEEF